MLKLAKIASADEVAVSFDTDSLVTFDINLNLYYSRNESINKGHICYIRYHSPDGQRLMTIDFDMDLGLIVRIESPNLNFDIKNSVIQIQDINMESGLPIFCINNYQPDLKYKNDNILDCTLNPFLEVYTNGIAFCTGLELEAAKLICPCRGLGFYVSESGALLKICCEINNKQILERFHDS